MVATPASALQQKTARDALTRAPRAALPAGGCIRTDEGDVDRGELDAEKRERAGQLAGSDGP